MTNFTHDDLKKLDDAIKQGVTQVDYNDRSVRYRSINEMLKIKQHIQQELGINNRGPQRVYASTRKGILS